MARRVLSALYAGRVVFVWFLLAIGLAVTIVSGWHWYAAWRDNATINALAGGENVEINAERAAPAVLFARAYYLLKRDRIDEAQVLLDQANFRADATTRVLMLYDAGNTRLRASFEAIERGKFDLATSLVNLAKEDYNQALRLDPQAWDVKYNLDVAARLVRDLPQIAPSEEPLQQEPRKDLWSDVPGVPRGAP
jgi:mxaK protein